MERIRRTRAAGAGLALLGALLTAGCGTPARDTAATRAPGAHGVAVATASGRAAPPPSPPAPSARRAPLPVSGACTTGQLSVTAAGHRTLDGLEVERFLATDVGPGACSLTGAPRLTPYGPLSAASAMTNDIAVSQEEFDGDDQGQDDAGRMDVQPGQAAAFDVAWYAASPVVCEKATGFGFSAPGDSTWGDMRQVGYAFGPVCDGLFYVSTVRAATP